MYDEILLEHNLYPKNRGSIERADIAKELKNASCGDKIIVQLKLEDGIITEGKFEGVGCAIALASADLMIESVKGKTLEEAKKMSRLFRTMILDEEEFESCGGEKQMGDAIALKIVSRMPARAKCAQLAWQVFLNK